MLTYGKVPRELGIPGEKKFIGRGVSTCATCDAPLFRNKNVAVIGGGNSALEAAELLTKFANKIYLVHRRDAFRADEITIDKVKTSPKVELALNSVPVEIKGEKFVKGLVVQNINTQEKRELPVEGVFVEIGYIVVTDFVKEYVNLNKVNEIVVNENAETRTPGLFSAGDLTTIPFKQTITSAGQGAIAGLAAYNYLMRLEGKAGVKADWA
jgi:thioredoxin reductase (NADPH)